MKKISIFVLLFKLCTSTFAQNSFTSSNLPIIIIETDGEEIVDEPKIPATLRIIWDYNQNRNNISDSNSDYYGKIGIEVRGYSSQILFPKKQYGFETQNIDGSNLNVSLLGLPKENDWILSAPYSDKTLMRNVIASTLANDLGHYAPKMRHCELILNGKYMGVYVLTEKAKIDKNRVNINKLNADDENITGGYLLKIDRSDKSNYEWKTDIDKLRLLCESPKKDEITASQKKYIKTYINNFEKSIYALLEGKNDFYEYVNLESFIDYFILQELSKDVDSYILSTYIQKDRDKPLRMGPVWDFNLAFGNASHLQGYATSGLVAETTTWWNIIYRDDEFIEKFEKRWKFLRNNQISSSNISNIIDSISSVLVEAGDRNFEKWDVLGKYVWPNYYIGETYSDEIEYLKQWFTNRIKWIDKSIEDRTLYKLASEKIAINAYPNPFVNKLKVDLVLDSELQITINAYNEHGAFLGSIINNQWCNKGVNQFEWSPNPFNNKATNGLYILVFKEQENIIKIQKFLNTNSF